MLVKNRMTSPPVTIGPEEFLDQAKFKMHAGHFHRLPVIKAEVLVGILTDRDIRQHTGRFSDVKVSEAMTENPHAISPAAILEDAAQMMLKKQIGGLPVVENGKLVGIITANDILKAFLDMMGATAQDSTRIDFVLEGEEHGLTEASRIVTREGGDVLGVGTYREKVGDNPVCYLRVVAKDPDRIGRALRSGGFDVLGVHRIGG